MSKWGDSIRRKTVDNIRGNRALFFATTGTMAQMSERIWGRGELTEGGKLQYDQDYEVWAYKPPAPRAVSGKGKPNKEGKRKKIKGGYYPTYLDFKEGQGRRDTYFDLTSAFRKDWLGGATPTPREVDSLLCVIEVGERSLGIINGLTAKKGKFIELSEDEKREHVERLRDIYAEGLNA